MRAIYIWEEHSKFYQLHLRKLKGLFLITMVFNYLIFLCIGTYVTCVPVAEFKTPLKEAIQCMDLFLTKVCKQTMEKICLYWSNSLLMQKSLFHIEHCSVFEENLKKNVQLVAWFFNKWNLSIFWMNNWHKFKERAWQDIERKKSMEFHSDQLSKCSVTPWS